jgi:hypothetical protein
MHADGRITWLRSFLQPVTYLGLGMAAFIVIGTAYLIQKDREDAYSIAHRNGGPWCRCSKVICRAR